VVAELQATLAAQQATIAMYEAFLAAQQPIITQMEARLAVKEAKKRQLEGKVQELQQTLQSSITDMEVDEWESSTWAGWSSSGTQDEGTGGWKRWVDYDHSKE
jgi:uncharacterized coiled-coil protein SlyX